jgi:branched-chain amino acid aminotransferase
MTQDVSLGAASPAWRRGAAPLVWVNGYRTAAEAPHLSALDRGFTLADGVFETMRVYDGHPFRLAAHVRRLRDATASLGIPLRGDIGGHVTEAVAEAAATGMREASVRVTVSRGVGPAGVAPSSPAEPTIVVTVSTLPAFPPETYTSGLAAHVASGRRNERAMTAGLKTIAYTDSIVALAEARAAGADDAIFLDSEGHVSEGSSSNVFVAAVADNADTADANVLVTPPLSCGALPGITRAAVMELAQTLGITVQVRPIQHDELLSSPELFLTSSLRGIAPVVRVDGHPLGGGEPGALTRQVMEAYAALVGRECRG